MAESLQIPGDICDQTVAALYAAMRVFRALPAETKDRFSGTLVRLSEATTKLDHSVRTARKGSY